MYIITTLALGYEYLELPNKLEKYTVKPVPMLLVYALGIMLASTCAGYAAFGTIGLYVVPIVLGSMGMFVYYKEKEAQEKR